MAMLFLLAVALLPCTMGYIGFFNRHHQVSPAETFHRTVDESMSFLRSTIPFTPTGTTKSYDLSYTSTATLEEMERLPWAESVNPSRVLSYMPFFEHQLDVLRKMDAKEIALPEHITFQLSSVKPARIGSMCFSNDKFRKVRMTYFDAGDAVQVIN